MKSSRAMLLAALMFAVPALAEETTPTATQTEVVVAAQETTAPTSTVETEKSTWFAAKLGVLTAAASKVANVPVTYVTNPVLYNIPFLNRYDSYRRNVPTMGKVIVATTLAYAAMKAYEAYNEAQNADLNEDEEIFGE